MTTKEKILRSGALIGTSTLETARIKMKKKIKKWGNSLVIVFTKEDIDTYGLKDGDVIDLDDMLIDAAPKKIQKEELKNVDAVKVPVNNPHSNRIYNMVRERSKKV